eukprot:6172004-Pleurochrysis_carterae.AAC.5
MSWRWAMKAGFGPASVCPHSHHDSVLRHSALLLAHPQCSPAAALAELKFDETDKFGRSR